MIRLLTDRSPGQINYPPVRSKITRLASFRTVIARTRAPIFGDRVGRARAMKEKKKERFNDRDATRAADRLSRNYVSAGHIARG